jgi:hypothetical protein
MGWYEPVWRPTRGRLTGMDRRLSESSLGGVGGARWGELTPTSGDGRDRLATVSRGDGADSELSRLRFAEPEEPEGAGEALREGGGEGGSVAGRGLVIGPRIWWPPWMSTGPLMRAAEDTDL